MATQLVASGPLQGVRILDLTRYQNGPAVGGAGFTLARRVLVPSAKQLRARRDVFYLYCFMCYRELGINWIPVYVHFTCAYVYVRISHVLLDMCDAYVR